MSHWLAGTALACALVVVAYLPPRALELERTSAATTVQQTLAKTMQDRLERHLRSTRITLRRLEGRRDVDELLRRQPVAPSTIRVLIASRRQPALERRLERALEGIRRGLGPTTSETAVVMVLALDHAYRPRASGYAHFDDLGFFQPAEMDGRTCVAMATVHATGPSEQEAWTSATRIPPGTWLRVLGPCMFYAALGRPGPFVERWLLQRRADVARSAWWVLGVSRERRPPEETEPRVAFGQILHGQVPRAYVELPDAVRCLGGDRTHCRDLVLDTTAVVDPDTLWYNEGHLAPFGPMGGILLSDLAEEMGRERFARFWRSPEEVEEAFADAFNVSVGQWTYTWATGRAGAMSLGSRLPLASIVLALLVAGLFAFAAIYFAYSREINERDAVTSALQESLGFPGA